MQKDELVSILMPVYNAGNFLEKAISSILNQTYSFWELLISNDGSTDNSGLIIEEFVKKDKRIKHFPNQINKGYLKTANKLCKLTQGSLVTYQDADDYSFSDRLEKQVKFLTDNKDITLVGTFASYYDEDLKRLLKVKTFPIRNEEINQMLFKYNQFCGASVMFRRELFESIGYYQETFDRIGNEDYDYFFRAAQKHKVANIPEYLYFVRNNRKSVSRNITNERQLISHLLVQFLAQQRKQFGKDSLSGLDPNLFFDYEKELLIQFKKDKAIFYRRIADQMMYQGFTRDALYAAFEAFSRKPFDLINIKYVFSTFIRLF